jgi:hypothetical protein
MGIEDQLEQCRIGVAYLERELPRRWMPRSDTAGDVCLGHGVHWAGANGSRRSCEVAVGPHA